MAKVKKIRKNMLELVTVFVDSIGEKNLNDFDRRVLQDILYNGRNPDVAKKRLATLEDNHKGNFVYKSNYIRVREILEKIDGSTQTTLADDLRVNVSEKQSCTLKEFVKHTLNEWIPANKNIGINILSMLRENIEELNIV